MSPANDVMCLHQCKLLLYHVARVSRLKTLKLHRTVFFSSKQLWLNACVGAWRNQVSFFACLARCHPYRKPDEDVVLCLGFPLVWGAQVEPVQCYINAGGNSMRRLLDGEVCPALASSCRN